MCSLYNLVRLVEKNSDCIIFKIIEAPGLMNLLKTGYLTGTETTFRVTRNEGDPYYSIWYQNGNFEEHSESSVNAYGRMWQLMKALRMVCDAYDYNVYESSDFDRRS